MTLDDFDFDCLQKDLELERSVGKWLEMVAGKKGKDESFERWIQDGTVLAKVRMEVKMILEMVAGKIYTDLGSRTKLFCQCCNDIHIYVQLILNCIITLLPNNQCFLLPRQ